MRKLLVLLALVMVTFAVSKCYTNVTTITVPVVGVSIGPGGIERGVVGKLMVTVAYPGNGDIYVASEPLTKVDTQGVARIAVMVASVLAHKDWTKYDFFFKFVTPSVIVGGPSAGIAMTVATYAALTGQKPLPYVAGTGTVGPDGVIGPVGGVYAKMVAAAKAGFKVIVIPKGEEIVTKRVTQAITTPFGFMETVKLVKVNITQEAKVLGIKVVPAATVYDALSVWLPKPPKVMYLNNISLPKTVVKIMEKWKEEYLEKYHRYALKVSGVSLQASALLQKATELAKLSEKTEDPYQAVNCAFTAAILAEEAYWYDKAVMQGFRVLIDLSEQAQKEIELANATVIKSMSYDANKLDALLTAATRVLKAYYYYHKALNSTDINDIINYLVLAKYYGEAAITWLDVAKVEPPGPSVNPERLKRESLALYSAAGGIFAYYLTIANQIAAPGVPELVVAVGMYKEANNMPYIYRMASAMYLSAISAYALHLSYNISPEVMYQKVMRALHYNAGLALSLGLKPYVAAIYYHSAQKSQGETAFLFAELASMHYLILSQLS